jgi:hypothetical protein
MTYFKLIAGIVIFITFVYFFTKSIKRYGFPKGLLSPDIIIGILAGLWLTVTSILALIGK